MPGSNARPASLKLEADDDDSVAKHEKPERSLVSTAASALSVTNSDPSSLLSPEVDGTSASGGTLLGPMLSGNLVPRRRSSLPAQMSHASRLVDDNPSPNSRYVPTSYPTSGSPSSIRAKPRPHRTISSKSLVTKRSTQLSTMLQQYQDHASKQSSELSTRGGVASGTSEHDTEQEMSLHSVAEHLLQRKLTQKALDEEDVKPEPLFNKKDLGRLLGVNATWPFPADEDAWVMANRAIYIEARHLRQVFNKIHACFNWSAMSVPPETWVVLQKWFNKFSARVMQIRHTEVGFLFPMVEACAKAQNKNLPLPSTMYADVESAIVMCGALVSQINSFTTTNVKKAMFDKCKELFNLFVDTTHDLVMEMERSVLPLYRKLCGPKDHQQMVVHMTKGCGLSVAFLLTPMRSAEVRKRYMSRILRINFITQLVRHLPHAKRREKRLEKAMSKINTYTSNTGRRMTSQMSMTRRGQPSASRPSMSVMRRSKSRNFSSMTTKSSSRPSTERRLH